MIALILAALAAVADAPGSRLAVIREAPDFALTAQTGEELRRDDLKGKVLLVSFVFTTCSVRVSITETLFEVELAT